ncbi:NAD-dependent epimerase/dehydratase family protein [Novosphingobium sp. ZN18A2]|uniref:NAD-dependent epimerase/dehydratase family protein n=1 Tax=Novosphingobium sp. ZN18A2 TaxID=3079861 RepID=UPI0030D4DADD
MAGTVLVTGGSGYIGGEIIRQLLAKGWTVHTTVRNLDSEARVRPLLGGSAETLKFFAANLTDDAGWAEAAAGCTHVCHVASPLPAEPPRHENDLIVPARDGALRALKAAKAAGAQRFVMTSSVAAIGYGHGKAKSRFTEDDWTDVDGPGVQAYAKSKTIAEGSARDWVATEGDGMEFATVNPALVLGPLASADFSTSIEAMKQLMTGALPGCPNFGFGIVDVRDVADLHVRVLEAPGMKDERFICSGPFLWMIDIARILKAELGPEARKVPLRRLPDFVVRIAALFNPVVRQVIGELGSRRDMDASHARDVLGWEPRPVRDTIVDTARSLIDLGIVKV